MDQLGEMRAFVRAAERGAFAQAARDLGLTPSAVSKLVSRIEARLGVPLVARTTRRLALTPEGERYFEVARGLIGEVDALESGIAAVAGRPRGRLRVASGYAFVIEQLAPALPDFLGRFPEVEVDLVVDDRTVDLIEAQIDVAVRTGTLMDSTLMRRRIAETRRVIVASPDYLARHGTPRRRQDLAQHRCVHFRGPPSATSTWPFVDPDGRAAAETVQVRLSTDSSIAALEFALRGSGLLRIGEMMVSRAVRAGRLVRVPVEGHQMDPQPLTAVFPAGRQRLARVRAFLDFLVERFGDAPWRLD